MIELTYRDLVTTPLVPAIRKLCSMSVFDGRTAYRLHKIHQKLDDVYKKSMTDFAFLGDAYGQKDEKGEFLKNEKGEHLPKEGMEADYRAALEEFLATKFNVEQHKISIDQLTTRFSPQEIGALEPILEGLEQKVA